MLDYLQKAPVFHDGEHLIQDQLGVREALAPFAERVIRDHIVEQHSSFYAQLPMLNIGALDETGQPWATASFGKPGFVSSPDGKTLSVESEILLASELNLQADRTDKIAILGLQPYTRRRNRLNGHVVSRTQRGFSIAVDQSFGNCPQYIQKRALEWRVAQLADRTIRSNEGISNDIALEIRSSDTFFIASRTKVINDDPRHGVDVSHRGGRPGFVGIDGDTLFFPDFRGNNYFNTLGNIASYSRVGLFFPNFETGNAVFVAGEAQIIWDDERVASFNGAQRIVEVKIKRSLMVSNALPLKGKYIEQWKPLEKTDTWADLENEYLESAKAL